MSTKAGSVAYNCAVVAGLLAVTSVASASLRGNFINYLLVVVGEVIVPPAYADNLKVNELKHTDWLLGSYQGELLHVNGSGKAFLQRAEGVSEVASDGIYKLSDGLTVGIKDGKVIKFSKLPKSYGMRLAQYPECMFPQFSQFSQFWQFFQSPYYNYEEDPILFGPPPGSISVREAYDKVVGDS